MKIKTVITWEEGDVVGGDEKSTPAAIRTYYRRNDKGVWNEFPESHNGRDLLDSKVTELVDKGYLVIYPEILRPKS